MRISYWSSDVCSSDLVVLGGGLLRHIAGTARIFGKEHGALDRRVALCFQAGDFGFVIGARPVEIHRHRPAARHSSARTAQEKYLKPLPGRPAVQRLSGRRARRQPAFRRLRAHSIDGPLSFRDTTPPVSTFGWG